MTQVNYSTWARLTVILALLYWCGDADLCTAHTRSSMGRRTRPFQQFLMLANATSKRRPSIRAKTGAALGGTRGLILHHHGCCHQPPQRSRYSTSIRGNPRMVCEVIRWGRS